MTENRISDITTSAAALYDVGWRAEDRDQLITEYDLTLEDAEAICEALKDIEEANDSSEDEDLLGVQHDRVERATEIAAAIRSMDTWDHDLCTELCELAGLEDEWEAADGDIFESILYKAADVFGVELI